METKEIIKQLRELAERQRGVWRRTDHCYEMLLEAADRLEAQEQSPDPYTQLW